VDALNVTMKNFDRRSRFTEMADKSATRAPST